MLSKVTFLASIFLILLLLHPTIQSGCKSDFTFEDHVCVISNPPSVKCWGFNSQGQLGMGNIDTIGNETFDMGSYLPSVNLGSDIPITLHMGEAVSCMVTTTFDSKCWGECDNGQCAQGSSDHRGNEPNEMGDYLDIISLGVGIQVASMSVGDDFVSIRSFSNQIKSWGYNGRGFVVIF